MDIKIKMRKDEDVFDWFGDLLVSFYNRKDTKEKPNFDNIMKDDEDEKNRTVQESIWKYEGGCP